MRLSLFAITLLLISACQHAQKQAADAIYFNGRFVTMNDSMPLARVMVVSKGKILAIGDSALLEQYTCAPDGMVDMKQQFVYPGWIDAHCHFYGYAKTLMSCNLVGTKSWDEVLTRLDTFAKQSKSVWVTGRGWDQNDWADKTYPTNEQLNNRFPDRPVMLKRVDGHAAICNQKALDLAGINAKTKVAGGENVLVNCHMSGVLVDNMVDLVEKVITPPDNTDLIAALKKAQQECFDLGLTTLADAGLDIETCLFLDSLEKKNVLKLYLYLMLNPTDNGLKFAQTKGIYETDHLKICSFKLYADGALGSRGAKLKKDYCDRPGYSGTLLNDVTYFDRWCSDIKNKTKYQVNTHCIGDSANRLLLEVYGKYLKGKNDERWRIEHAQVIDTADLYLFEQYSIIPSVQPTHATSDGSWAEARLCRHRMKGAYAYRTLLNLNHYLPLGTDFPVEYINPLYTFYSAVYRENATIPEQAPFLTNESLTAMDAIKGMTIWAAKACRLEHRKGSLEAGKDADFIVLDKDLLHVPKNEVLKTKVVRTYMGGVPVN